MADPNLIAKCKKGDKSSFVELFNQNRRIIEHVVMRTVQNKETAKDVIQEIFLRIFKNIHSFNGTCKVSTWIYRLSLNESLRYIAKTKRTSFESYDLLNEYPSDQAGPLTEVMVDEQKKIINHYINDLQPDFKSVIVMFYYGNMKAEDIAKSLNIPLGTVNSRIARARNMLREKVKKEFELS